MSDTTAEDTTITVSAVTTGIAMVAAFSAVLLEYWVRRMGGWGGSDLARWIARLGTVIAIGGVGMLGLSLGARMVREHDKLRSVAVAGVCALALGALCLADETVMTETALLFDRDAAAQRPWELSLGHQPNLWLRYQLLRGCGAGLIVVGLGLLGGALRRESRAG